MKGKLINAARMAEERKECEMYLKNTNNSYKDYTSF